MSFLEIEKTFINLDEHTISGININSTDDKDEWEIKVFSILNSRMNTKQMYDGKISIPFHGTEEEAVDLVKSKLK